MNGFTAGYALIYLKSRRIKTTVLHRAELRRAINHSYRESSFRYQFLYSVYSFTKYFNPCIHYQKVQNWCQDFFLKFLNEFTHISHAAYFK